MIPFIISLLHRVKGGGHAFIRKKFKKGTLVYRLLDGKIVSSVLFGILCFFVTDPFYTQWTTQWAVPVVAGLCWLAAMAPSIGEEIGAIGGIKGNWPDNDESWFGSKLFWRGGEWTRTQGWLSGFTRGLYSGLLLALGTGIHWFILMGMAFPVCVFVGVSIGQMTTGLLRSGWEIYEYIWGAVLGLAFFWSKKK